LKSLISTLDCSNLERRSEAPTIADKSGEIGGDIRPSPARRNLDTGVLPIAAGVALIRHSSEWLLILGGIVSVLLGVVLFFAPGAGIVAISWWLGIYALLFGIALRATAFRIRHRPV
jgi:hypothetical protein